MRLLAALLLATLPMGALAQSFDSRPGGGNAQGGMVIPEMAPMPQVQAPAPIAPPVDAGRFQAITMNPPTMETLFKARSVALNRNDARDLGTQGWAYSVYDSGAQGTKPTRAIVALVPPGMEPTSAISSLDLRAFSRDAGWRLLLMPVPQTQRVQSGTLGEIAEAQRNSANDGERIGRILAAVLSQEGAFQPPALIATEGTGNGLLALLCARAGRGPEPSHAVVMGGTLDQRAAAACQPNRVPALLIARSTADTGTPYGGGEQPTLPGQPQTQSPNVLSAPGTRGLWASLARCRQTEPTLNWLPAASGRTALETHGNCSAGGPVGLLTAMDGSTLPTDETLVSIITTFLNGELF